MSKNIIKSNSLILAYLRDSGGEEQELSTEQQLAQVRTWCSENNFTLHDVFIDEARTASSTTARTAFKQMISAFKDPACPAKDLVIWKFSRFARNIDDAQYYKALLRRTGITIHSIKDTIPEGLNGRFFEAAVDWMNAKYLEDLSIDVKRGLHHNLKTHGAVGGTPPRGFTRKQFKIGTHRNGQVHLVSRWVPDPETWDRAKLAWQMRAAGASLNEIRKATGNLYTTNSGLQHFFRNRLYIGELCYGGQVIPDYVEPMIDQNTWDRVQAINEARSIKNTPAGIDNPHHPRRKKSTYLLSGLVYCAHCGSLMNGETHTHTKKNHVNYYYACRNHKLNKGCKARNLPRHTVEEAVIEALLEHLQDPEKIRLLQQQAQSLKQEESSSLQTKKAQIKNDLHSINDQIDRLVNAIAQHGHSENILAKLKKLETQQAELQSQLNHYLRITIDLPENELKNYGQLVTKALRSADPETKRTILRGLIDHITAEREGNEVRGMIYFFDPTTGLCVSKKPPKGACLYAQPSSLSFTRTVSIAYYNPYSGLRKQTLSHL